LTISRNRFNATNNNPIPGLPAMKTSNIKILRLMGASRTKARVLRKLSIINRLRHISIIFKTTKKPEEIRIPIYAAAGPSIAGIGIKLKKKFNPKTRKGRANK